MENKYYEIRYSFSSGPGLIEGSEYITTYIGKIFEIDIDTEDTAQIGELTLRMVLITQAINDDFDLYEIFDNYGYLINVGKQIMDFESRELNEDIQKFYDYTFPNSDICIIEQLEILDSHRSKGIGKKIVKDIFKRFSSSCSLFIVEAFPLQFESRDSRVKPSEWEEKLNVQKLEKDYEKAFYQLKAFYQKIGFSHIDGYDDFMFWNSSFLNEYLKEI